MEVHTENGSAFWTTPQCPFAIEYSPRVLDDIRLAIMDAFFSLPRGGAEIGGILLGSHANGCVTIAAYQALDCEHAFGPGFTLSDNDKARLARLLATPRGPGLETVGWYHSHTRSEIFLSEADLEIHRAFFGEPWQVALVMKPHTFQPPRVGFFFREPDGSLHGSASYHEFQFEPLAIRQVPGGAPPIEPAPVPESPLAAGLSSLANKVITVAAEAVDAHPESAQPQAGELLAEAPRREPEPVPEPVAAEPEEEPADETEEQPEGAPVAFSPASRLPRFLQAAPRRSFWSRRWVQALAAVVAGMAIGSAAYLTRQAWLPPVLAGMSHFHSAPASAAAPARPVPPPTIALNVLEADGQLQIHWDQNSAVVRSASQAVLEIVDSGAPPKSFPLDAARLGSGSFTYTRQSERVDIVLTVAQSGGKPLRETTTFVGNPPVKPEDTAGLKKRIDDLGRQNLQLEADLKAAVERSRKLQKSLADSQALFRKQQRSRLENQMAK